LVFTGPFVRGRPVEDQLSSGSVSLLATGFTMSFVYFLLSQGFHNFIHNAVADFVALSLF
jgi:hypothetical protein